MKRIFLAGAAALLLSGHAMAQTLPGAAFDPAGHPAPPAPTALLQQFGSATSPCIVGSAASCGLIVSHVPPGASLSASSGNVANASAVATLAGAAAKTTYITGFACTATGATAASVQNLTVAGLIGGTATFTFAFPAGATVSAQPLVITFPTPIPASAVNTAIVVTLPAGGAGNTNAACSAFGFQL